MRALRGRPKRSAFTPMSSDSFCDFEEERKRRKVSENAPIVLDSSTDTLLSPIQRTPLHSSTPSVQLTAVPRTGNSFVRQMALCEPLEESVVKFCTDTEDGEKNEALSNGELTGRQSVTVLPDQSSEIQPYHSGRVTQHAGSGGKTSVTQHTGSGGKTGVTQHAGSRDKTVVTQHTGSRDKTGVTQHTGSGGKTTVTQHVGSGGKTSVTQHVGSGGKTSVTQHAGSRDKTGVTQHTGSGGKTSVTQHAGSGGKTSVTQHAGSEDKTGVTQHVGSGGKKTGVTRNVDSRSGSELRAPANVPGSGVKCLSVKMSPGASAFCVLSPVLVSSPESQSVICLDDLRGSRRQDGDSFFCASSELFSCEDLPSNDECPASGPRRSAGVGTLAGSPSSAFLKGVSSDTFSRKSFQPVVRLYSEAVEEYLQEKMEKKHTENLRENLTNTANHCKTGLINGMWPLVLLDRQAVPKYFKEKATDLLEERTVPHIESSCTSPVLHTGLKTPLVTASVIRSRIQGSAAPQTANTTGRKVCISGFSAKRWGTQKKKSAKTLQQLSFQDYSDGSMLLFREGVSRVGVLSPSLLFSPSMLTSSFLNSSAVRDLNLSDSLSVRDPQKEHQRWARLRAALSLHRKKKVQAGLPSSHKARNRSIPGNHSSLLLLSPFQASLCSDDLTDEEKVLVECQQEKPVSFYRCLTLEQLRQCQKVGEGVYGEVFRTLRAGHHVALKVIPIEGSQKVNGEAQKSFAEILPEIIISKELSLLSGGEKNITSGFIKLHSAYCVQGSYPSELLSAWDDFAEEKGTENERPDVFGEEQLFMILEFEFGGDDLERISCKLPSVSASRSILHQVTAALAVAEEELRFEHRDLHWGNILIEKCSERSVSACLQGETLHIPTASVRVKIIDYTLSRLDKDGLTVFCDLSSDEELFLGEGDLQFDVYRCMREENQNNWSLYRPRSNVLWLHYLCDKLLSEVQYLKKPSSAAQQRELRRLRDFRRDVRQFSSASDILRRSKLFN